jgi:hypothetical protein
MKAIFIMSYIVALQFFVGSVSWAQESSSADLADKVQGFYVQKIKSQEGPSGRQVRRQGQKQGNLSGGSMRSGLDRVNLAEVIKIDDHNVRVIVKIQGQTPEDYCMMDADLLKMGDAFVYVEPSPWGTCEVTVTNFRNRGLIVYENKESSSCQRIFCKGESRLDVRLFDKL